MRWRNQNYFQLWPLLTDDVGHKLNTKHITPIANPTPLIAATAPDEIGAGSAIPRRISSSCPKKLTYAMPHKKAHAAARIGRPVLTFLPVRHAPNNRKAPMM